MRSESNPAAVSGGTLSTAILMPSQVVPQLIHTTRNRTAVTRLATRTCRLLIVRA